MNERAGLGAASAAGIKIALDELKPLARERGATRTRSIRQKLAQLTIKAKLLRLNSSARPDDDHEARVPGRRGRCRSRSGARFQPTLTEVAVEVLAGGRLLGRAVNLPPAGSRANSIERRHQILKNIVAERVLRLRSCADMGKHPKAAR